jgi:vanillate O-demethylase ferredoxin subunit
MSLPSMLEVRIAKRSVAAVDIVALELAPVADRALPAFSAGAHIHVEIGPGLVRQYSLCNDPSETHRYVIGVLRDPNSRGGSAAVHDRLAEGQVIRIGAPRNHFALVPARRYVLFAGGIGVTPILCMAERLARDTAAFEMHYCSRSPDRTAFMARIQASPFADRVHFHHDDGEPAQRLDLSAVLFPPDADSHLYVCGPRGFIDFVCGGAKASGWTAQQIHFEHFSGTAAATSDDGSFEVQIASSGKTIGVPAGQSVVEALREHRIVVPVSCEQGVCGTCLTRVIEGEPDHRDMYLTDEEKLHNDQFLPCCSRAKSKRLVLDL